MRAFNCEHPEQGRRPSRRSCSAIPSRLYHCCYTCLESFSIQNVLYPPPPIPCSTFSAFSGRPPPATVESGVLGLKSARCRAQICASACKKFEYFQIFSNVSHHFSNIFKRFAPLFNRFRTFSNTTCAFDTKNSDASSQLVWVIL